MTSLFRLEKAFARLLVDAKDHQNFTAQETFQALFTEPVLTAVSSLIHNYSIEHVVFAPLRKQRLLNPDWHPNLFFFKKISASPELANKVNFSVSTTTNSARQASLDTEKRARNRDDLIFQNREELSPARELKDTSGVLFIDDVLTSGESSLRCYLSSPANLRNRPWLVLTLFRTPTCLIN